MIPRTHSTSLRALSLLSLLTILTLSITAQAKDGPSHKVIKSPAKGSPYYAIIEGLKLIEAEHFNAWMTEWCSTSELCLNDRTRNSLKKYNLPAMKRMAPHCLKGRDDELHVTRTDGDPAKDTSVKVFIKCKEGGMPRPMWLKKEDGGWRFEKI